MLPRPLAICLLTATIVLPACSKDPQVAKMEYLRSGDEYAAQKKYPEAIVQYRNALNQDPNFGEAKAKLAQAYLDNGEMANAFREFIRAADLLPNDPQAQLRAGELLLAAQQFDDARTRAEKALAIDGSLIEAQILRANALAGHPWESWAAGEADAETQRMPGAKSRWTGGKDLSWEPLRPELVIEVAYDHMQGDRFRHTAHFRRWRPDKPPRECTYAQLEVVAPEELSAIFASGR